MDVWGPQGHPGVITQQGNFNTGPPGKFNAALGPLLLPLRVPNGPSVDPEGPLRGPLGAPQDLVRVPKGPAGASTKKLEGLFGG